MSAGLELRTRMFAVIAAAMLCVFPSFAADGGCGLRTDCAAEEENPFRYEVRLGWGGYPLWDAVVYMAYMSEPSCQTTMETVYGGYSGPVYVTGVISAEFSLILKKWFTLAFGLNFDAFYSSDFDSITHRRTGVERGAVVTLMPQARFTYFSRPMVKIYSSVGVGIAGGGFRGDSYLLPAVQLVPIGVTFGKDFFGFVEGGIGSLYVGCMAGIGYRF